MMPGPQEISRWFENLFEGKVIYRERFIYVVLLEDVEITSNGFSATAVPLLGITPWYLSEIVRERGMRPLTGPWPFVTSWDLVSACNENEICSPYAGWTIWIKPDLVRAVELLLRAGLEEPAIKLLG